MQALRRLGYSRVQPIGVIVGAAIALLTLSSTSTCWATSLSLVDETAVSSVPTGEARWHSSLRSTSHSRQRTALSPDEIHAAPRNWAERAYPKLIYFNDLPKGRHFTAWEQPELFADRNDSCRRAIRLD